MSKQPPPAPTARAVGPCPTLLQKNLGHVQALSEYEIKHAGRMASSADPGPEVIKNLMLNSAEHEIFSAHKC